MNTFSKICVCAGEANVIYTRMQMIYDCCMRDPADRDEHLEFWDTDECLHHLKVCRQSAEELVEKLDALIGELE